MQMADELQLPVLSIDYRLSPEVVYPAALDDCVRAYLGITAQRPRLPVLFGDSAGGGLVLALMQRLRDLDAVQPAALGLITPWTDLTPTGDSRVANDGRDPILTWHNQLDKAARAYAGTTPLDDPLVSPINATWDASLPPSVIMTGTRDLLLSDCVRLYWRLREAGARTELRVWEGMWHGFTGEPGIPEAEQCRREIATFLLAGLCDR